MVLHKWYITINSHRNFPNCGEKGNKGKESKPDFEEISNNVENILTSGQYINKYDDIPPTIPLELLGYNFVHDHNDTKHCYGEKNFLE